MGYPSNGGSSRRGFRSGGSKVVMIPHRHAGVFIAKWGGDKADALCTRNLVPGDSAYNDKIISVQEEDGTKIEYRVWNHFRSKLAAAFIAVPHNIWIVPGAHVLCLGSTSVITVLCVSDIVGPEGKVFAVEYSQRRGKDLVNMAKKRTNIIPIIEDARDPSKYRMLVSMVDVIYADVALPDTTRAVALNASYFLKVGGHFVTTIKVNFNGNAVVPVELPCGLEAKKLRGEGFKATELVTLEPFFNEIDHACIVGGYRMPNEQKLKRVRKHLKRVPEQGGVSGARGDEEMHDSTVDASQMPPWAHQMCAQQTKWQSDMNAQQLQWQSGFDARQQLWHQQHQKWHWEDVQWHERVDARLGRI